MARKFKCKIPSRKISENTLKKKSCEELVIRLRCYLKKIDEYGSCESDLTTSFNNRGEDLKGRKITKTEFKKREKMCNRRFKNVLKNFENTRNVSFDKQCPPLTPLEMKEKLEQAFPTHRFRKWRNTIQIPKNFTGDEIKKLHQIVPDLSSHNYKVRSNRNRYWISPVRLEEPGKHLQESTKLR